MEYLALPLVLRDGQFDRASVRESITYCVGLLLSTRLGMMKFRPDYGCDIWEMEYSDLYAASKADILSSLRNTIDKHERRLYGVSISFVNVDDNAPHSLGLAVSVSGTFKEDDEEKEFQAKYELG